MLQLQRLANDTVEGQSSVWKSWAKKFVLIADGGTFTHVPPLATPLLIVVSMLCLF